MFRWLMSIARWWADTSGSVLTLLDGRGCFQVLHGHFWVADGNFAYGGRDILGSNQILLCGGMTLKVI